MIVNGTVEFVGSDRRRAAGAIMSVMSSSATAPLTLSATDGGGHRVLLDYRAEHPPEGAVVNVAIVERGLDSEIARVRTPGGRFGRTTSYAPSRRRAWTPSGARCSW
ncbi:hypothetical protein NKG94_08475 [Micromonospora sp. M12]